MCCLFGMLDPEHQSTGKQRARILRILAAASEARGTDATGVAYNSGGKLHVFKRPHPAHKIRFHIPEDALAVMGHTRMTTQGDARRNYNNHPFQAKAWTHTFPHLYPQTMSARHLKSWWRRQERECMCS